MITATVRTWKTAYYLPPVFEVFHYLPMERTFDKYSLLSLLYVDNDVRDLSLRYVPYYYLILL
jgi:hypothetical protein